MTVPEIVYQTSDITVILGDCRDVLPTLSGVDAVIADPPYGVGLGVGTDKRGASGSVRRHGLAKDAYGDYEDTYENFVSEIIPRLNACLDLAGRAAVFTGPHIQEQRKATAIGGVYCPVGSGRHAWGFKTFLPVLFYGQAPELNKGAKPITIVSNVRAEKVDHPCPKPLEWMRWLVDLASRRDELVLDPFAGSGTTGVACLKSGRRCILVERDERYIPTIVRRLKEAETPLFAGVEP